MTDTRSQWESDLNKLEATMLRRGFNYCVEDLNKVLMDECTATTSPEVMALLIRVQARIYEMAEVRFPKDNQQN